MSALVWRLDGTAWEGWLDSAPPPEIDSSGELYRTAMMRWLDDCPGKAAPLSEEQQEQLANWVDDYQLKLQHARQSRPKSNADKVWQAAAGFSVGVTSASVGFALGGASALPIGILGAIASGLLGLGFAASAWVEGRRGARRFDRLEEVYHALNLVATTRYAPSAPSPPAAPLATTRALAIKPVRFKLPPADDR